MIRLGCFTRNGVRSLVRIERSIDFMHDSVPLNKARIVTAFLPKKYYCCALDAEFTRHEPYRENVKTNQTDDR